MSVVSEATQHSTALSGTTEELFRIWKDACVESSVQPNAQREESRKFFRSILKGTRVVTENGVSLSTKSSHEESLALLIQQLGPAFAGTLASRLKALACIRGALDACHSMPLSLKLIQLLGNFYETHCGPVEPDPGNDLDEQLRDEAIEGLIALFHTKIDIHTEESLEKFVQARIQYSLNSIQRRCAVPDYEESEQYSSATLSGLSVLPRSRRSLCFQLLRSAIDSIAIHVNKSIYCDLTPETQVEVQRFARFSARCLQGESDPRCLMQMLQILDAMLKAFRAIVRTLPIGDIFEVTAPYYPIQFTPPPHDVHGITREGLRGALLSILRNFDYDEALVDEGQDSMIRLSLGLVLEVLVPLPGDGPATTTELREGLEDLESMLFDIGNNDISRIGLLLPAQLREISDTLVVVHDQTSLAATGKDARDPNRFLADKCRDLVARIAADAERVSHAHWSAFVADTLKTMISKMQSSSQKRVAIAYAACLCSCGGPLTLRQTLEDFLEALLNQLDSAFVEEADVITCLYGLGAFFSSSGVALEKAQRHGIAISPHPLTQYSSAALDKVLSLVALLPLDDSSIGVTMAATRTIESILVNSPPDSLTDQSERINKFLQSLVRVACDNVETSDQSDWRHVCAEVTGRMLGRALNDTSSGKTPSTSFSFKNEALQALITSACLPSTGERNDQYALALATTLSLTSATKIVQILVEKMVAILGEGKIVEVENCANLLAFLFLEKGSFSARAFQKLDKQGCTALELLNNLAICYSNGLSCKTDQEAGINQVLPIASLLATAYKSVSVPEHIDTLISNTMTSAPLGGELEDVLKNVVGTVLLSSVLCQDGLSLSSQAESKLWDIRYDLARFALSPQNPGRARSYAAQCLHCVAWRFSPSSSVCPIQPLIIEATGKTIESFILQNGPAKKEETAIIGPDEIADCLSLICVLGSAAARKGGLSSKTADRVVEWTLNVACNGILCTPFTSIKNLDLTTTAHSDMALSVRVSAAFSFGSMFDTHEPSQLWKQRLAHLASKQLTLYLQEAAEVSVGGLTAVCNLICVGELRTITSPQMKSFARVLVRGLSPGMVDLSASYTSAVLKITLASIVKLLSFAPASVDGLEYQIVVGAMRAFVKSDELGSLSCKLLSLQTIQAVASLSGIHHVVKEVKGPVVSILGAAMNHPSGLLRQACVEVRNSWLLIE